MHANDTVRIWMHQMHDGTVKAAHATGHMFHEKAFWGIVLIAALLAGLFTAIVLLGNNAVLPRYSVPMPYGTYY
ncbi:hypothetical protein [Pontiella sulfatireligans]|uniref:Uncharacterized protein n=1 Tax=Pontiella sulfatireligans TaxID=2750658 RepID=A0A6C2UGW5_9BACT|nr:hypothetical protein [Pontiella sulfatireligans]VGO19169.1 hypothetical protein SCARR_01226 [Pontiella sulfatireligans]